MHSGNSRHFDLTLPSNRWVLAATPFAGAAAGLIALLAGSSLSDAVGYGIGAGGAIFLTWALTRELHPDRPVLAVLASAAAPVAVISSSPSLLSAAVVLLAARMLASTTGDLPQWIDAAVVVALAVPAGFSAVGPGVLIGAGATLGILGRRRLEELGLALALVVIGVVALLRGDPAGWQWDPFLIIGGLAGVLALRGPKAVATDPDSGTGLIPESGVRVARLLTLAAALAGAATGEPAALAPLWAALVVCGIVAS